MRGSGGGWVEIVEGEVNVGQAARGKHGFPPAQIPISGAGLRRLVRWPKPAAFSKAWCEINNVNGLKPRQNICHKMRRMNNLTIRDRSGDLTANIVIIPSARYSKSFRESCRQTNECRDSVRDHQLLGSRQPP